MVGCGDGGEVWGNGVQPILRGGRQESGECTNLSIYGKTPIPNG